MNKPLIIGITGGIGGGKSTLSRMLREKGYHVYDTDAEAKRLQNENSIVREQLKKLFGEEIYNEQGLDKKKIANLVFRNPELLSKLNQIIHPVVRQDFFDWQKQHADEEYLFVESAIMFESGFYKFTDKIVVVTAPEKVRIDRVVKRDGVTPEQVRARISNQLAEKEKIKRADIVLNSNGENVLEKNLKRIIAELEK